MPGASGYIGWRTVASAAPDGYTLMMAENALVIRPGFKDIKPQFDPTTEFTPIAFAATSPLAICVANAVPANTMKELIALSHSSAKKLTFASAGVTSVSQLVWDVVRDGAKIDAIDVPYRGGGPAMADLIAGHVDLTLPSSQVAKPLVDTKRIKCLAVTGKTRSPALPKVPTLDEVGIKHADVDLRFWFAVFGPKNLPAEVTAKLQKAIKASLETPELKERLKALDITPEYAAGPELGRARGQRRQKLGRFIEATGSKGNRRPAMIVCAGLRAGANFYLHDPGKRARALEDRSRRAQKWVNEEFFKVLDVFGFRSVMFVEWGFGPPTCAAPPSASRIPMAVVKQWVRTAEQEQKLAEEAEASGHRESAAEFYYRAALYYGPPCGVPARQHAAQTRALPAHGALLHAIYRIVRRGPVRRVESRSRTAKPSPASCKPCPAPKARRHACWSSPAWTPSRSTCRAPITITSAAAAWRR